LKKEGYLNNHKKEKLFESSMEKARRIPHDVVGHMKEYHMYIGRGVKSIMTKNTL
jgi:hypothetical protein